METRDLTANRQGYDYQSCKRLRVLLPNVPKDAALAHLALNQRGGMILRCRRGPRGGYLTPRYLMSSDKVPRNDFRWQWFIVVEVVKEDDD